MPASGENLGGMKRLGSALVVETYLGLEQFWAVCVVWGALVVTAFGQTWAARTDLAGNLAALPRPQMGGRGAR